MARRDPEAARRRFIETRGRLTLNPTKIEMSLFGTPTASAPASGLFGSTTPAASGLFGAATTTAAPASGLFGATKPAAAPASGLFGAPAATSAPATGLFGAPAATTSAPASGLFGAPAAAPASGLFGSPATTSAAPTLGLFGAKPAVTPASGLFGAPATTSAPATGLFGAPATTSAPASGLFGAKPAMPATGGGLFGGPKPATGGLFGSTAPAAGGGLFASTAPAGGMFGGAQQQLAPAQQRGTVEDLIQNSTALVASVGDPQIFPDERNGIIALLNQLQAVVGIGKGYYNPQASPVEYNMNGPYFRLKGICYNRMSDFDDADGMISLVLKVSAAKCASSQIRQQIVDELYAVLGNKPNLQPRIDSIVSLPNDKTEVTFYVEERGKGRIECNLLAQFFRQEAQSKALQAKLEVEQLVPRAGISKQCLRHYLENPPEGFDPNVWAQAVAENPDPEKLIPFPIRGVDELLDRQKRQKLEMNLQNNMAADMVEQVKTTKRELSQLHAHMLALRQKQKQLSYRLLRVLAMQTLIQRYGARLEDNEMALNARLQQITVHLNSPGNIKDRLEAIKDALKNELPRLTERQKQLNDPKRVFRGLDVHKFREYLCEIQTALEQVFEVSSEHGTDLEVMEKKSNW